MLNTNLSTQGVPHSGPLQAALQRTPAQPRVVENVSAAQLRAHQRGSSRARLPSALDDLAQSARQFAELLDTTGSLTVAATVSGLSIGAFDVYA